MLVMGPIEKLQSEIDKKLADVQAEVDMQEMGDTVTINIKVPQKIIKVKLPRDRHPLMELDTLLIDLKDQKQYVAYETELDKMAFDIVLEDTLLVVRKFISDDFTVKHTRSLFQSGREYLSFDVSGKYYNYSILNDSVNLN